MKKKTLEQQYDESVKANILKINSGIEKLLNSAGIKMKTTTKQLQKVNNNYNTGRLRELTNFDLKEKKDSWLLTFGSNASSNGYNYGIVQEFGHKAGKWPHIGVLKEWVVNKARLGHLTIDKKLGRTQDIRIDNLTFLIARAIKENGIEGRYYYRNGLFAGNELFIKELNKTILKAFNE